MAKRCWNSRCCGAFLLSHQRREPRRHGKWVKCVGEWRDSSIQLTNNLVRLVVICLRMSDLPNLQKKTSMFIASPESCSNRVIRSTLAVQWLWCPPCTTESPFRCSTCTYQITPSTASSVQGWHDFHELKKKFVHGDVMKIYHQRITNYHLFSIWCHDPTMAGDSQIKVEWL